MEDRGLPPNKQCAEGKHSVFEYDVDESDKHIMRWICERCGKVIEEHEDSTP